MYSHFSIREKTQQRDTKILNLRQRWCKNKTNTYDIYFCSMLAAIASICRLFLLALASGVHHVLLDFLLTCPSLPIWLIQYIVLDVWISETAINAKFPLVSDLPRLIDSLYSLAVTLRVTWFQQYLCDAFGGCIKERSLDSKGCLASSSCTP